MNYEWVKPRYPLINGITIGIDKVSISIPFNPPNPNYVDPTPDQLNELKHANAHYRKEFLDHINYVRDTLKNIFKTKSPKPTKKGSLLDRIDIFCEKDGTRIATVMLGIYYKTPVLEYSFNPGKLTQEGLFELDALFCLTLFNHYEGLYTEGVISRFEFFIDVEGVNPYELTLLDMSKRKTTLFKSTTYQSRRGRPLVGTMYDKAAQLKSDLPLTRIETRIKRRDITFQYLVESGIDNPFASLLVVPASALSVIASEWNNPLLVSQIREHGLYGGIKNKHARKAITTRFSELTVSWWDPDEIWKQFIKIMLGFKPRYIVDAKNPIVQEYLPDMPALQ